MGGRDLPIGDSRFMIFMSQKPEIGKWRRSPESTLVGETVFTETGVECLQEVPAREQKPIITQERMTCKGLERRVLFLLTPEEHRLLELDQRGPTSDFLGW